MVAFLIEKKLKITANPREITNDDSAGFRTFADTASTYTAKIDLKGNAKTEWMRNAGLSPGVQVTLFNIELQFSGGAIITGSFYVAAFTEGGESGASRELTLTLESAGQWEITNGGVTPPVVGITFGEYPYLAGIDTLSVSAAVSSVELKPQPRTDLDTLTINAGVNSIELEIAAVYNNENAGTDTLTINAGVNSIELEVAAVYSNHSIYDVDKLTINAAINSIELIGV